MAVYKTDAYGLPCPCRIGLTVAAGLTLLVGGSAGLMHFPPHPEIRHVEQEQHPPLNIGRFGIVVTVKQKAN